MTFDIGLHEMCVQMGGRASIRYVITKFSRMGSLPNFVTHGAPLRALRARESSAINEFQELVACLSQQYRTIVSFRGHFLLKQKYSTN